MPDPVVQATVSRIFQPLLQMQFSQTGNPYDELMAQIEPELVTGNLANLQEAYKRETPEQAAARAERYSKAFVSFDEKFKESVSSWDQQIAQFQRMALASTEREDRAAESAQLDSIDDALRSA
jgi:protoporphyrinogen oxidase